MILSPEQSGQTEIGLQPFQDHFAFYFFSGRSVRVIER
jgi:hypothetical protein